MANPTMTLIASNTVGSGGVASVTFSSIPNTYTDLVLQISARTGGAGAVYDGLKITFNGNTSSYSERLLYGIGSAVASASQSGDNSTHFQYGDTNDATTNTFGSATIYIPNYAGSNYKSTSADSVAENNGTANIAALNAGLWSNSAAISSISIAINSGYNFLQYSTAYLYGISNS